MFFAITFGGGWRGGGCSLQNSILGCYKAHRGTRNYDGQPMTWSLELTNEVDFVQTSLLLSFDIFRFYHGIRFVDRLIYTHIYIYCEKARYRSIYLLRTQVPAPDQGLFIVIHGYSVGCSNRNTRLSYVVHRGRLLKEWTKKRDSIHQPLWAGNPQSWFPYLLIISSEIRAKPIIEKFSSYTCRNAQSPERDNTYGIIQ